MSVRYVYKLVLPGGEGRRVSLNAQPTWDVLASRVHELFSIPVNDVGLVYIDDDGDEITVSSDFELQDYHDNLGRRSPVYAHTSPRKFIVRNLAVSGARRPASDSSSSSFSFVKHSPVERNPSVSPSGLHKPRSLSSPQPPHERGRSPSPVFLSESRIIAQEEAEGLISFIHGQNQVRPPSNIGLEIETRNFISPSIRHRSLSNQRSRSLSPSFIRMAGSSPSDAPEFESFRHTPILPEIVRDYPPTPPLHHSHPASPYHYYRPAQSSRSTSPPIILGGIRGPTATASSPVQYITTEDILNFITPVSRPLSSLSRRSLSSPAPLRSRPPSVINTDSICPRSPRSPRPRSIRDINSRPQSMVFSDHHPIPRSSFVLYTPEQRSRRSSMCTDERSTRPQSPANIRDFIGRTPPSICEAPLLPDEFIRSIGTATSPERRSVVLQRFFRSLSARTSRSPPVRSSRSPSPRRHTPLSTASPQRLSFYSPRSVANEADFAMPVPRDPFESPSRVPSRSPSRSPSRVPFRSSSRSPSKELIRSPSRSPFKDPIRSPSRDPYESPSRALSRSSSFPRLDRSRSSSPKIIYLRDSRSLSRESSVCKEHAIIVDPPQPRSSRGSSVVSGCRPNVPSIIPRSASIASSTPERYSERIIVMRSRSSSREPWPSREQPPRPPLDTSYLATVRNNLVKTTLEQLRNVSQGVITSLGQEMETLKNEMTQSIQQRFEDMKQETLKGAQVSLDGVRTEMDIVKVEARELLEVKEKLRNDVSQLVHEMRTLRWDIDLAKDDLRRISSQVNQEREGMEVQMRDMISQLQRERALRDSERKAEKAKEEQVPTREPVYNPFYIPVPPESHHEEALGEDEETEEEEEKDKAQRRTSTYNPSYVSLPPHKESADEETEEKIHTPELKSGPIPSPLPPVGFWGPPPERRMTWGGYFPVGPVAPLPPPITPLPPPPPPPPPPRPFTETYLDTPVTNVNANERRFPRHLPRPPTQEDANGNATLSGSDLDGNSANVNGNGFRSPFVPTNLSRANTVGGGRFSDYRRWGRGDEALGWGNFGVPGRYRQQRIRSDEGERGNSSFSTIHDGNEESRVIENVRRGFVPTGALPIPPPHPVPFHGPFGLRRMSSVPGRLNGSTRFAHNHWRHSFGHVGTIAENDDLHPHPAPFTRRAPPAPASAPTPGASSTGGDLSSKPSTEQMSSSGTRIERVEVEEARRAYKSKKAAWKRQRDEARKAFMTQTPGQPDSSTTQQQPGRVRPFDAMAIPAELPNSNGNGAVPTMPGALPELPAPRQGVLPLSRTTLPPPPPPLPRFNQQQQSQQFPNIRFGYPAMPGSLPVPPSQGTTPQPDLHVHHHHHHQQQQQQQPPQQGSEPRSVRWSVRFAPPPGPGYPPPEHVRPRSVPSPFPPPVGTGAESTDEEVRPALRPVNVNIESSDEEGRDNLPVTLPPLVQPAQRFPLFQTERQLKNYVLNKLFSMGFKSLSGAFDSIVEKEVRDETARVNGNLRNANAISIVERLVERLLTNPTFLNGTNANANSNLRSMSPSPRVLAALAAADANTSTSGVGTGFGSSTVPASNAGSIPGQWNGRDL